MTALVYLNTSQRRHLLCFLEDGTTCLERQSIVADRWCGGCGKYLLQWSVCRTAQGPLVPFVLCRQVSCVGPNLLRFTTSNNMPIDSTWNQILLAALNGLNLRRAFFFPLWKAYDIGRSHSVEKAVGRWLCACVCVQLVSIYVLLSVLHIHVLQIAVRHRSAPLKSLLLQLADCTSL